MPYDKATSATLADAIASLKVHPDLSDTQLRDMISSINRVAKYLDRPPADLPTQAPALRMLLASIHPVQAGISAKSLSNVKTSLAKALQTSGFLPPADPKLEPSEAWATFLSACEAKHQEHALSRLVTYCGTRGIEPVGLNNKVMAAFQTHLDERLLGKDPAKLCKEMAQSWNGIVKRQNLPLAELSYKKGGQHRSRPLASYPQSLQADITSYLDRLSRADPFDEDGPDKALRPTTLRNITAHLRQYLDALVTAGVDPEALLSLADAINAANMKLAFTAIIKRRRLNSREDAGLHNIAATLKAAARHYLKVSEDELGAILKIQKKVSPTTSGMSRKNRDRLGQFNNWQNVARLLSLPDALMKHALAAPASRVSGLLAMKAVAISILLSCPMRVKNLAELELEFHVKRHPNGARPHYSIRVDAEDVKNNEHIEVVLNAHTSKLLHTYIMKFRPLLTRANGPALFPQQGSGKPRDPGNFGKDIKSLIYRETGLTVHAHLFRHLAAFLYLKERPGDFETVRRLLKHKTQQTSMTFYADLSNQWAHEHYDKVVLGKLGGTHD